MMRVKKSTHNENKQTPDCSSSSSTTHSHYPLCFAYYNYHTQITTEISLHNFYSSIFPHCKLKMKRLHILFPFLLLSLMLVVLYATSSTFQQTTTGHFKIATAAYDTGNAGRNSQKVKRNRKEAYEQKLRKTPSGPSPVGNNRPPSKA